MRSAGICSARDIRAAVFFVSGSVACATVGVFDPRQQVYVTHRTDRALEIAACRGTVAPRGDRPLVFGHVLLVDETGETAGGRLFSPTTVVYAEIDLQEVVTPALGRNDDPETGIPALDWPGRLGGTFR